MADGSKGMSSNCWRAKSEAASGRIPASRTVLIVVCIVSGLVTWSLTLADVSKRNGARVPSWAKDAVWYQVFVSRFCNGTRTNDPPGTLDWTDDWAHLLPGESPPLRERLFFRRYGGDIQGLRSRLAYIRDLGVNTLYLNPVFQAESQHKYDTADHRHIDDSFGVTGSRHRLQEETTNPATWEWSDSDRIFLDFLDDAHHQGFRVVIDGVFNHVGREHWAWRDVEANGRRSPYADWFAVTSWEPLQWQAWDGPNGHLPEFRRYNDGFHPAVEAHIFAVVRRWMDPDGDSDPSEGIDGWRLDAAEKVPPGFWRRFRQTVKRINPEALIVGEIWTDARAWLAGDQFDVVTNYQFTNPVLRFLTQDNRLFGADKFSDQMDEVRRRHPWPVTAGMLNLIGSHDTERAVTAMIDPQRRQITATIRKRPTTNAKDGAALAHENLRKSANIPRRDTLVPDDDAYRRVQLAAVLQFTYPGAPLIYNGDELGLYGGDDPFCRQPIPWTDDGQPRPRKDLRDLYRRLAALRARHSALRHGRYELILADAAWRLYAFRRSLDDEEVIVVVNGGTAAVDVGAGAMGTERPLKVVHLVPTAADWHGADKRLDREMDTLPCPGLSAVALIRKPVKPEGRKGR